MILDVETSPTLPSIAAPSPSSFPHGVVIIDYLGVAVKTEGVADTHNIYW